MTNHRYNNYDLETLREYFPDDKAEFLAEYHDKHYSQIPKERIDKVDWLGWGWPTLDAYGELVDISDGEEYDGSKHCVVCDPSGGEWMFRFYDEKDLPKGLREIDD